MAVLSLYTFNSLPSLSLLLSSSPPPIALQSLERYHSIDWMSLQKNYLVLINRRFKSQHPPNKSQGSRYSEKEWGVRSSETGQRLKSSLSQVDVKNGENMLEMRNYHTSNKLKDVSSLGANGRKKIEVESSTKNKFCRLLEELDLDEKSFPLLDYLSSFGLKDLHFIQMYDRHMPSLQNKCGFCPGKVGILVGCCVENSLKPTVRYLVEEVGIQKSDLSKVVQLSPQILLLHYSIEDGLLPRINFLRSIGMRNSDILKVLTSLTQVFSLSVEDNLKPKYRYLINELRNEVQSLAKYPTYLSLSLEQRIRPRHRFLVSLKKAPKGPFPLSSFVPSDESFCQQWAGTTVDKYLAFRQRLLLKEFAKKYER
ncbi:mitochondrial transcription termination factor family protein [Actinidia rufa]|uniref:Mitochondrial transcription termination factor family protein n=1 Tax=Actinidia rufa TaxID=165716 RepID=A0A7J0H1I6_9ERIC|nr:mitochondrial transcription termination factor family protein [Actinidia rufa]